MTHLALPSFLAAAVRRSGCDFIVTGAGGWIGRATLSLLADALGPADFRRRVTGVAAAARPLRLMNRVDIDLVELDVLERIEPRPCLLLHFAFLGREKVAAMTLPDYVAGNETIALRLRRAILRLKPRGVLLSSSGAVYGRDGAIETDLARNPYGVLKHRDETAFAQCCGEAGARLVVPRIFNLAGAYINKLDSYALASFIRDALARRPIAIRAPHRVERSYVGVSDVIALALAVLLDPGATSVTFDTAGERVVEVGELAALVLDALGRTGLGIERPPADPALAPDRYVGNPADMRALAARHGVAFEGLVSQIRGTAAYLDHCGDTSGASA